MNICNIEDKDIARLVLRRARPADLAEGMMVYAGQKRLGQIVAILTPEAEADVLALREELGIGPSDD